MFSSIKRRPNLSIPVYTAKVWNSEKKASKSSPSLCCSWSKSLKVARLVKILLNATYKVLNIAGILLILINLSSLIRGLILEVALPSRRKAIYAN